jgi:hypothetical protein
MDGVVREALDDDFRAYAARVAHRDADYGECVGHDLSSGDVVS